MKDSLFSGCSPSRDLWVTPGQQGEKKNFGPLSSSILVLFHCYKTLTADPLLRDGPIELDFLQPWR